jgi:DNA-binding MarR family transcriptional regulator
MSSFDTPLQISECNCFTARKAARQITRLYDAHLQPTGLRITQFLLLASLNGLESAAVSELAEHLDVESSAMGKMAGFLERDGLVSIHPSPTDGRSRIVKLTETGRRLLAQAEPLWQAAQRQFRAMNGAAKVDELRQDLQQLKFEHA